MTHDERIELMARVMRTVREELETLRRCLAGGK
jgi:hypothetical protein